MLLNKTPINDDFNFTELGVIAKNNDEVFYKKPSGDWCKSSFVEAKNKAVAYWRVYKYFLPIALEPSNID